MITELPFQLPQSVVVDAANSLPSIDFKLSLNKPTNRFFYDPWVIKDEFKGTVWQTILDSLPFIQGEARLIKLESGTNYYSHADIDDRWHFNIISEQSYLLDLDNNQMYPVVADGKWYNMRAGRIHSAANFGSFSRIQLVVRQLLKNNTLIDPIKLEVSFENPKYDFRYRFDNQFSPWLNWANQNSIIANFEQKSNSVIFDIEKEAVYIVKNLLDDVDFNIKTI